MREDRVDQCRRTHPSGLKRSHEGGLCLRRVATPRTWEARHASAGCEFKPRPQVSIPPQTVYCACQCAVRQESWRRCVGARTPSLQRRVEGRRCLFSGANASEATVRHLQDEGASAIDHVVFSTHGYLDQKNPDLSGIVLSQTNLGQSKDGYLRASELSAFNFSERSGFHLYVRDRCGQMGVGRWLAVCALCRRKCEYHLDLMASPRLVARRNLSSISFAK